MIELTGTREEIATAVKAVSPTWPTELIDHLDPGEWHFILCGVDTLVFIVEDNCTNAASLQKENENLKRMVEDLNRRIAILMDT